MDTIDKLQAYLSSAPIHYNGGDKYRDVLPSIQCADGFYISVQASRTHYCSPREDEGPWHQVECGFPSEHPGDEMLEHAEDKERPTDTAYGYVPVGIVERLIDRHGGIKD